MPKVVEPRGHSVYQPLLLDSEAVEISQEQRLYIRKVLELTSSDMQFANKAFDAIEYILIKGPVTVPEVTSLSPASAAIGDPYFDIHVHGTDFTPESKIVFNGFEEPTVFVSATELTTGVNMPLWLAPVTVPVSVLSVDGVMSNSVDFEFTAPV